MKKEILSILFRYILIILADLGNLYIFYKLLTPLTIQAIRFILSIKGEEVIVKGTSIATNSTAIVFLVPACVAGAAFYLLFILVFSTPKIKPVKKIAILAYSFVLLFLFNITRIIFLFSIIGQPNFEIIHWIFWNLVSTIFVVGIWLSAVYIFKIKETPVYSDFNYMINFVKSK